MPSTPAFIAHCLELMAPLGLARVRRMFGGHGVYLDELFVAVIDDECLYLKVDALSRASFEQAGCAALRFVGRDGREAVMGFYAAPEEALDSPALMAPWLRLAQAAALRSRAAATPRKATRPQRR